MKFVPVSGTTVLFSIWETRVKDYKAFVDVTQRKLDKPNFTQTEDHPAAT